MRTKTEKIESSKGIPKDKKNYLKKGGIINPFCPLWNTEYHFFAFLYCGDSEKRLSFSFQRLFLVLQRFRGAAPEIS